MLLSEHVYCVAVAFRVTEQIEQSICVNIISSLNIPLWKLFQWFRRLQLWATGDWQLHCDNTVTHASCLLQFLVKHEITQVTQSPYSPDLVPCDFWLFPKLKSPLKGKRFYTIDEIQENAMGQLMVIGRLCEVPRCLLWRGLSSHCSVYNVSYILYLLQKMSLFFILHGWIPSGHTSLYVSYEYPVCLSNYQFQYFSCQKSSWSNES